MIKKETDFHARFILDPRKERVEEVLQYRTRYLSVILEDIYQSQNASAVLRTCDSCGIQDVHIIENKNEYQLNPDVTQGADKWLKLHKYKNPDADNVSSCLNHLKEKGYKIVATTLEDFTHSPDELPVDRPLALAFGNEKEGLSENLIRQSDYRMKIPIFGFSQSFNISVSAAITLYFLINRLHKSEFHWQLSIEERDILRLEWYRKITGIPVNQTNQGNS